MHFRDGALVVGVRFVRNEPQVTRLVTLLHIGTIQFENRVVPSVQRDEVLQKRPAVFNPFRVNVDAPAPIVWVGFALRVVAPLDAVADSVE